MYSVCEPQGMVTTHRAAGDMSRDAPWLVIANCHLDSPVVSCEPLWATLRYHVSSKYVYG